MGWSVAIAVGLAVAIGSIWGFRLASDIIFGATIVLLPNLWSILRISSQRVGWGPVWIAVARYSLAALGFAVLFTLRPYSAPLMVLLGSVVILFLPPILLGWELQQHEQQCSNSAKRK